ncbi:hypothetical protein [Pantoea sp. SORGH_AS_0659]|uniref:hypothetical protein n=1 Tax=Pantoea sp. SORGH_AS_0659 TaxID=3062597 RepID=UPI0028575A6C|nr:hypothetical protein [Pantoea sp. SORGH_AS_0659]MDR6352497.1 hypothetical protein [Pantoea sp. SORGH_AS_0659]
MKVTVYTIMAFSVIFYTLLLVELDLFYISCNARTTFIFIEDHRVVAGKGRWEIYSHFHKTVGHFEGGVFYYETEYEPSKTEEVNVAFETENILIGRVFRLFTRFVSEGITNTSTPSQRINFISPVLSEGEVSYRTINYSDAIGFTIGIGESYRMICS